MKVTFELSARDIRYFRDRLKTARSSAARTDEKSVVGPAAKLVEEARAAEPPEFVLERLLKLQQLVDMLHDREWRLEGRDRARILDALAYFVDPDDLIPDRIPGIGYLDDAIMVELVVQDLKHEIEAFEAFVTYRKERKKQKSLSDDGLAKRRASLQGRMRRRRRGDRERHSRKRGRSPISLW